MDEATCTRLKQFWDDIDAKDTSLLDRVLACHVTKPRSHVQDDDDDADGPPSPLPARATCVPRIYQRPCDPAIKLGVDAVDVFLRQSRSVCLKSTNSTNSTNSTHSIWAMQTRPRR